MSKNIIAKLPPAEALLNMEKVRAIAIDKAIEHLFTPQSYAERDVAVKTVRDAFELADLYELSIYRRIALEKMMEER